MLSNQLPFWYLRPVILANLLRLWNKRHAKISGVAVYRYVNQWHSHVHRVIWVLCHMCYMLVDSSCLFRSQTGISMIDLRFQPIVPVNHVTCRSSGWMVDSYHQPGFVVFGFKYLFCSAMQPMILVVHAQDSFCVPCLALSEDRSFSLLWTSVWNSLFVRTADSFTSFRSQHKTCKEVYKTFVGGTAAAVPPPFRPSEPVLCVSHSLVTPY